MIQKLNRNRIALFSEYFQQLSRSLKVRINERRLDRYKLSPKWEKEKLFLIKQVCDIMLLQ